MFLPFQSCTISLNTASWGFYKIVYCNEPSLVTITITLGSYFAVSCLVMPCQAVDIGAGGMR